MTIPSQADLALVPHQQQLQLQITAVVDSPTTAVEAMQTLIQTFEEAAKEKERLELEEEFKRALFCKLHDAPAEWARFPKVTNVIVMLNLMLGQWMFEVHNPAFERLNKILDCLIQLEKNNAEVDLPAGLTLTDLQQTEVHGFRITEGKHTDKTERFDYPTKKHALTKLRTEMQKGHLHMLRTANVMRGVDEQHPSFEKLPDQRAFDVQKQKALLAQVLLIAPLVTLHKAPPDFEPTPDLLELKKQKLLQDDEELWCLLSQPRISTHIAGFRFASWIFMCTPDEKLAIRHFLTGYAIIATLMALTPTHHLSEMVALPWLSLVPLPPPDDDAAVASTTTTAPTPLTEEELSSACTVYLRQSLQTQTYVQKGAQMLISVTKIILNADAKQPALIIDNSFNLLRDTFAFLQDGKLIKNEDAALLEHELEICIRPLLEQHCQVRPPIPPSKEEQEKEEQAMMKLTEQERLLVQAKKQHTFAKSVNGACSMIEAITNERSEYIMTSLPDNYRKILGLVGKTIADQAKPLVDILVVLDEETGLPRNATMQEVFVNPSIYGMLLRLKKCATNVMDNFAIVNRVKPTTTVRRITVDEEQQQQEEESCEQSGVVASIAKKKKSILVVEDTRTSLTAEDEQIMQQIQDLLQAPPLTDEEQQGESNLLDALNGFVMNEKLESRENDYAILRKEAEEAAALAAAASAGTVLEEPKPSATVLEMLKDYLRFNRSIFNILKKTFQKTYRELRNPPPKRKAITKQ